MRTRWSNAVKSAARHTYAGTSEKRVGGNKKLKLLLWSTRFFVKPR